VVWIAPLRTTLGLTYRFEAYTPVAKRKRGYYALRTLAQSRNRMGQPIGKNGELTSEFGYIKSPPRDRTYNKNSKPN